MRRPCAALVCAALLAACDQQGTIVFSLVFPQGATRLPAATVRVRLRLSAPATVAEGPVASDGSFDLALSVPADGTTGQVTLEALDAGGAVLARGSSPPLALAAENEDLRLFVAPPGAFALAPTVIAPARADLAVAPLPYGLLIAGGRLADGSRSDAVAIYSAYHHDLAAGLSLPSPRASSSAASASYGLVYLFGGVGTGEVPAADLWSLDTSVAPAGAYATLTSDASLVRAGAAVAALGSDRFLVAGEPPVLLDGPGGRAVAFANAPAGAGEAATATATDDAHVLLVGAAGVTVYDVAADQFAAGAATARREHAAILLPDGDVLIVGGIDAAGGPALTGTLRVHTDGPTDNGPPLATARRRPALALCAGQLLVAGGFDDADVGLADAEILDAATLAPVTIAALAGPRGDATLLALPNGTALLIGGRDAAAGAPVGTIEIYTP